MSDPTQVIPTARNAHSIITDNTNRYVFVPHLGTDQIFQFRFDAKTGKLTANTPPVVQMKAGTGPRHIIMSPDNKFAYLLNELVATVTTLSLDAKTGLLTEVSSASALPADSKLVPGAPRGAVGAPGQAPRDTSNDIWASDLHLTPDGKFLYAAERTSSSIGAFSVDAATGKLTYLVEHADREAAARLPHRSQGPLHGRLRRKVGHDLGLRDRPGERRAQAAAEVPDGQGLELGGDRRLRLS